MAKKKEEIKNCPVISSRAERLKKLTEKVEGLKVWSQVQRPPVVRTNVTSLNRLMNCGGIPGGQLGIIHGPSSSGKTLLVSEILRAVTAAGGLGYYFDIEKRAVDIDWYQAVCRECLDEIGYHRVTIFEECTEKFELFRQDFRDAKKSGDIDPGGILCIAIDSVDRLRPKAMADEYQKDGKVAARGYPVKAAMLADWLAKFTPTMENDEIILFVMREGVNINAKPGQKTWRVRGGDGPRYDAGWQVRCLERGKIAREEGDDKKVLGYKHEIHIEKNSMGAVAGSDPAFFYSSAGLIDDMPLGLNRIREVREELLRREWFYSKGAWYYGKNQEETLKWHGKDKFLEWLQDVNEDGQKNFEILADKLDDEFTRN